MGVCRVFLGIDIGTSSVKALLVDENEKVVAQASAPLTVTEMRSGKLKIHSAVPAIRAYLPGKTLTCRIPIENLHGQLSGSSRRFGRRGLGGQLPAEHGRERVAVGGDDQRDGGAGYQW